MLFLCCLAVILGVSVCLQGTANGLLSSRIGLPLTLTINSGIVFVGSLAWLALARARAPTSAPLAAPWSYYAGGICGLLIISCAAVAYPRLGASTTTVLAVASQIATALVIDRLGFLGPRMPFGALRILGVVLLVAGVALVLGWGSKAAR
jgi:bacterial/archaeal transporter family-2 protein